MSNRDAMVILVFVCLAVILVAGCANSSANNGAATPETSNSVMITAVASPLPTTSASQDPIVGKWSYTTPHGSSAQVVFGADGSFSGYIDGGSQVIRSGTWQNIGGGKYTVTISGQASPENWMLNINTNMAYNSAYPTLGYSRVSGG
jgi:hypothetical protein